jgi:hypothetical protein
VEVDRWVGEEALGKQVAEAPLVGYCDVNGDGIVWNRDSGLVQIFCYSIKLLPLSFLLGKGGFEAQDSNRAPSQCSGQRVSLLLHPGASSPPRTSRLLSLDQRDH